MIKIDPSLALSFALLAFSTFVYDTLDVCTRLARYIFQELTGLKEGSPPSSPRWLPSSFPDLPPLHQEKGYLVAWPIFGSSNQLLATLFWPWRSG